MNCLQPNNLLILFLLWNIALSVSGQTQQEGFVSIENELNWQLKPGEEKELVLLFEIANGYHIQANQVPDENLIPTSITLKYDDDISIKEPVYPDPLPFYLKNTASKMMVFHEKMEVTLPVTVAIEATSKTYVIEGNLHYQTCDSVKCYFPRDLPFNLELEVK